MPIATPQQYREMLDNAKKANLLIQPSMSPFKPSTPRWLPSRKLVLMASFKFQPVR